MLAAKASNHRRFNLDNCMRILKKIFWPILANFESGEGEFTYKPLNRKILIFIGVMFGGLCSGIIYLAVQAEEIGYAIPAVVFFGVSLVCLTVGLLGSKRAVFNIWGGR
jgi:hypothetical protein